MVIHEIKRRFNIEPRLIRPSELRLFPDARSISGYRLCCVVRNSDGLKLTPNTWVTISRNGEVWEEIHQVGLELHQRELVALNPEILRQISLRCFNDLRTILLVHDKRMLGIVKQEIPQLVARSVLTPHQAQVLRDGIVDTFLPGSQEMKKLLRMFTHSPQVKCHYLLKPIRSGKGAGIVFGSEVASEDWISAVKALVPSMVAPGVACVIQRRVLPILYDMVFKASVGRVRYPLVGTYHASNGKLLGLGIWRSNEGNIIAVSSGGSWMCSVIGEVERIEELSV